MDLSAIPAGNKAPDVVNVVIEVPMEGSPVKYELDKDSGALKVDRILHTPMRYPCNYGFVPQTLGDDGDPLDVLVVSTVPFIAGCFVEARPVGVLLMEDEKGKDEKIIAVPASKTYPYFDHVQQTEDLPEILRQQIRHFFERYKDLEPGKWVKVTGWGSAEDAKQLIRSSLQAA